METYKTTIWRRRLADLDPILLALGRPHVVIVARKADGDEQEISPVMLVEERALHLVIAGGFEGDLLGRRSELGSIGVHFCLEDVVPIGSPGQAEFASFVEEIGVDRVVGLARIGLEADGAVVRPRAELHGWGGRQANRRGLRAESRHRVIYVVLVSNFVYIGCLCKHANRAKTRLAVCGVDPNAPQLQLIANSDS